MRTEIKINTLELHTFLSAGIENRKDQHMDGDVQFYNYDKSLMATFSPRMAHIGELPKFQYGIKISKVRRLYDMLKSIPEQPLVLVLGEDSIKIKSISL